tara:strand:- start:82 stop:972 length:891 start_codon:yes stop_codon:yes gene_type:complete
LLNEDESFYKIDKVEWIKTGQENINNFILNHKSIDAIIIGGSNSAAGLSAALLSELTNKNFYNLSESSEGENDLDYLKTINLKTSNLDRNDVRVIIYSTLKLLSNDENRINNEISKPKIKLLPTTSIASNIKQKTIPYLKKYFLKNNEFKERKTVNDFDKNKIYYEHEEYGDRKITNNFDKYKVSFKFNKSMSLNLIINNLISVKNNYQKLFPNSKFIVVSPTVYNKDPEFQNSFINKLSKELLKNNIEFISQPPISDFLPIWTDPIHLNQDGRNLRTNELYKLLKNNYDLENLLK